MSQDREWVKQQVINILLKEDAASRHSDLWNTFVAPFTDIVKAAGLSGQDILSAVKLNLKVLVSLDPDTIKKAHDDYDQRKKDLDAKWKPMMDANKAAGGGDVALLTFALAPGMFLGAQLGKAATKAPANIYDYMDAAGWSLPLRGMIPGAKPAAPPDPNEKKGILGTAKDVVGKLADIFFIAHHAPKGPLIAEAKGESGALQFSIGEADDKAEDTSNKDKGIKDIDKEIESYLEETGLDQVFKAQADEMLDMREEMLDGLLSKAKPQLELISALIAAQTPDEFEQALETTKQSGLAEAVPPTFKADFEKQAETIAKDEKFLEGLKKDNPEITEEEVLEIATKTAFSSAKDQLQVQLEDGREDVVGQAIEAMEYDLPEETSKKIIQKTPVGKQYYELLDKAKNELMDYIRQ